MDILSQVQWGDIGPSGLLAIAVLAIIQGWLVPRRTYDALAQDRDYWRDAAMEKRAAGRGAGPMRPRPR